jgi:opacity protein-like surface antigen
MTLCDNDKIIVEAAYSIVQGMYVLPGTLIFIAMLSGSPMLLAQAYPAATRALDIQVGGGFTTLNPDTQPDRFNGGAAYFDVNFEGCLGVVGEFHYATDAQGSGRYEKTYEIGGRYFRTYGRLRPYAKVLYGRGVYNFTLPTANSPAGGPYTYVSVENLAYNLIAGGAGVDYKLLRHINLRADWEYQHWFSYQRSALSPNLITIGAAYHF